MAVDEPRTRYLRADAVIDEPPLTLAIVLAASLTSAPALGQSVMLTARDGEVEHQLYVTGGMGVYIVGPEGSATETRTACAVTVTTDRGRRPLRIHAGIQLGRAPRPACEASALPHVSLNASNDGGTLFARRPRGGWARLPTRANASASLVFSSTTPSARTAPC